MTCIGECGAVRNAMARATIHPANIQPNTMLTTATAAKSGARQAQPIRSGSRHSATAAAIGTVHSPTIAERVLRRCDTGPGGTPRPELPQ
jgi:hypothetical protein